MTLPLDAEEESAIYKAKQAEMTATGAAGDNPAEEVGHIADSVRVAMMTLTLKLSSAIPHLFTGKVAAKALDELCAAIAEHVVGRCMMTMDCQRLVSACEA
jgi:hypothetical protein